MQAAQRIIVPGLRPQAIRLAIAAVMASVLRSSIKGRAMTLIAKTKVAKKAADREVDERKVGLLESEHGAHHVAESGQSAGKEERKDDDRRPRPDQQDHCQQGREDADIGEVAAPGGKGGEEFRRFPVLDPPAQVIEPQGEERAEQQKAGSQSGEECVGLGKDHLHQPAGGGKAGAIEQAGAASLPAVLPAGA
jgi:hypothetical protein